MEHRSLKGQGVRVYRRTTPVNAAVVPPPRRSTAAVMSEAASSSSAGPARSAPPKKAEAGGDGNATRERGGVASFVASMVLKSTANISRGIERRFRWLMNRHRDSYRPAAAAGAFRRQNAGFGNLAGLNFGVPIRRAGLSLIMNGSICPSGSYGNTPYFVKNSCPFDSVIVAVANAYMDYEQYAEFVDGTENAFLQLAKELGMYGPSKALYDKRLELLLPFFKFVVDTYYTSPPTLRTLDVECNVWKIVQDYLKCDPSSIQVKTCSNEEGCPGGLERIRYSASVVLNNCEQIGIEGFSCLQELMEMYISPTTTACMKYGCDGVTNTKRIMGRHVFIETDSLSTDVMKFRCLLADIPLDMCLAGERFVLQAVIHFTSYHYMTYVRRPSGKWEIHNDMQSDIKTLRTLENVIVCPHAVVYIKL